jgi:glycosyl-4,4'-diaponeurosporenoate acyltransferase
VIVELGDGWAVALSASTWLLVSVAVGWWAARWPAERLVPGPLTRLRRWEDDGAWWQRRLAVRRWKDRLPEAGRSFGGVSKRRLPGRGRAGLEQFRRETVRAERVHWLLLLSTPVHLVWCRLPVAFGMVAFGFVFTLPFIIIQRANRGRIDRLLRARDRRQQIS